MASAEQQLAGVTVRADSESKQCYIGGRCWGDAAYTLPTHPHMRPFVTQGKC